MLLTLKQAKEWLRERAPKGARCPCCNQKVQIYARRLGEEHCEFLANLLRHKRDPFLDDWVHHAVANTYGNKNSRGYTTIRWFGLAETYKCEDDNPKKRMSGMWRITRMGWDFLDNKVRVPKYIYTYNAEVLNTSDETVTVHDALPNGYNYTEMMHRTIPPGTQTNMF